MSTRGKTPSPELPASSSTEIKTEFPGWYLGEIPLNLKKKATSWPANKAVASTVKILAETSPLQISFCFADPGETPVVSQARYVEPVDDSSRYFSTILISEHGSQTNVGFAFTTRDESFLFLQSLKSSLNSQAFPTDSASSSSSAAASSNASLFNRSFSAASQGRPRFSSGQSFLLKTLLQVFYLEGFINLFSGIYIMLAPQTALELMGVRDISPQAADLFRWFGSLCCLLGYIGLFAPVTRGNIEALLLGDVLYLAVWYHFISLYAEFNLWSLLPAALLVVFLAVARAIFLLTLSKTSPRAPSSRSTTSKKIQ